MVTEVQVLYYDNNYCEGLNVNMQARRKSKRLYTTLLNEAFSLEKYFVQGTTFFFELKIVYT